MRLSIAAALCAVVATVAVSHVTAGSAAPFYDDFSSCTVGGLPDPSKWNVPLKQWGGDDINGGVNPKNVECVTDSTLGKTVLQFTAHGDLYNGTGPIGVTHDGTPRAANDQWKGWDWGYDPKCAPYCNVRRVGGAIQSVQTFTGGELEVSMKPCPQFGVASAIWLFNYSVHMCDPATETCSPAYAQQCCTGGVCTTATDVCNGVWVDNQEMDIELPTSDAAQRAFNPDYINFQNMRFSTYTALASTHAAKCGVVTPCSEQEYQFAGVIPQNNGAYHTYRLNWYTNNHTATFSVDGMTTAKYSGANLVPNLGQLWLAAWFPNAWAGSPDFGTCTMSVNYVKFTPVA